MKKVIESIEKETQNMEEFLDEVNGDRSVFDFCKEVIKCLGSMNGKIREILEESKNDCSAVDFIAIGYILGIIVAYKNTLEGLINNNCTELDSFLVLHENVEVTKNLVDGLNSENISETARVLFREV